tara:strand:- start:441 stop:608 length:168 start_codon:yes stop_codon:yes gene_type:complete
MPEEPTLMEQLNSIVKEKQSDKSYQNSVSLNKIRKVGCREVEQKEKQEKESDFEI